MGKTERGCVADENGRQAAVTFDTEEYRALVEVLEERESIPP